MAIPHQRHMTADEFEQFTAQPENAERRWEFIGGEVIEVPSNPYSSQVAALIIAALLNFVMPRKLGHVTGEGAGYIVAGEKLSPDVAFVSIKRQTFLPYNVQYNPLAPDFMVEVLSPTNKTDKRERAALERKIKACAEAGVLLWVADPNPISVRVYAPGKPTLQLSIDGMLDGGEVLPGFELAVRDIFPPQNLS